MQTSAGWSQDSKNSTEYSQPYSQLTNIYTLKVTEGRGGKGKGEGEEEEEEGKEREKTCKTLYISPYTHI